MYLLEENYIFKHCHMDNFLENSVYEHIVAFFRFQHWFLKSNKNHWYRLHDNSHNYVHRNDFIVKASSPVSCVITLQEQLTNPSFLTTVVKDKLKLIDHELKHTDVLDVNVCGLMMSSNSFIRTHADYSFPHKKNEIVLKMIYYGHDQWEPEWYGELEFWNNGIIKYHYECIPNRLIVFLSDDLSFHRVSYISQLPNDTYRNSVVFNIRLSLSND